jgi:hypothetical protein
VSSPKARVQLVLGSKSNPRLAIVVSFLIREGLSQKSPEFSNPPGHSSLMSLILQSTASMVVHVNCFFRSRKLLPICFRTLNLGPQKKETRHIMEFSGKDEIAFIKDI